MIINERKLFGIFTYKTVFFPSQAAMTEIAEGLGATQLARFFWTAAEFEAGGRMIGHQSTATVCVDLRNASEQLWSAVAKNGRNEIRGAERLGSRVRIARDGAEARQHFLALYTAFAQVKREVAAFSPDILQRYGDHAEVFVAYLDEQPMCSHVCLRDTTLGRVRLLYSASRRLEDKQTARLCGNLNRLLHWHEMAAYRTDGFVTYDFGGIREDKNDGIAKFKTSFGGEVIREHTYLCAGSPWIGAAVRGVLENFRRGGARAAAECGNPPQVQAQACNSASEASGS